MNNGDDYVLLIRLETWSHHFPYQIEQVWLSFI